MGSEQKETQLPYKLQNRTALDGIILFNRVKMKIFLHLYLYMWVITEIKNVEF